MMTSFIIHKADGTNHLFKPSSKGLCFSDVKHDISYALVNTDSFKNNIQFMSTLMHVKHRLSKTQLEDLILKISLDI